MLRNTYESDHNVELIEIHKFNKNPNPKESIDAIIHLI